MSEHHPTHAAAPALRVHIHRGGDEIGGNCVGLICGDAHLIVDMGRPLGAKPDPCWEQGCAAHRRSTVTGDDWTAPLQLM